MSYLVFCTFDLKNASAQDYQNAYSDLEKLGLKKVVVSSQGNKVVIPTTAALGEFNGDNASTICTEIRNRIRTAFTSRRLRSESFVVVGGSWAWGAGTT